MASLVIPAALILAMVAAKFIVQFISTFYGDVRAAKTIHTAAITENSITVPNAAPLML